MKSQNSLSTLLQEGTHIMQKEIGVYPVESELIFYSNQQFQDFIQINNFDRNCSGLYISENYKAYLDADSRFLIPNLFHEYYGHGVYSEFSLMDQRLRNTIKPCEEIIDNLGLFENQWYNYEGFAVWLEYLLSSSLGYQELFENKLKNFMSKDYQKAFLAFLDFEERFSRIGLLGQIGLPKYYDNNQLKESLEIIFQDKLKDIEFLIANGSRKPYSDIDIFMVSNLGYINHDIGWLDIYGRGNNEFRELANNLDISVTERIFNGELIYGDSREFGKIKNEIANIPITQQAITHNEEMIKKIKGYSSNDYFQSYSKNIEALKQGRKPLTLENLL